MEFIQNNFEKMSHDDTKIIVKESTKKKSCQTIEENKAVNYLGILTS